MALVHLRLHLPYNESIIEVEVNDSIPLSEALSQYVPHLDRMHLIYQESILTPIFSTHFLQIKNNSDLYFLAKNSSTQMKEETQTTLKKQQQNAMESINKRFLASNDIRLNIAPHLSLEGIRLRDQRLTKIEGNEREYRKLLHRFSKTGKTPDTF